MRVLMVHNRHLIPGGEDQSFIQESQLLEQHGHKVIPYLQDNRIIADQPLWQVGLRSIWSHTDYQAIANIIQQSQPDILHVQNTFPLISPSIYHAAKNQHLPVVMSLRNYRLYCLNSYFFRAGNVCEKCINQPIPVSGIYHQCYRDSLAGSLTTASMMTLHRGLRTYQRLVDVFIALTEFARQKFVTHGFPPHKVVVKPNFVNSPPAIALKRDNHALYIGRLSVEKGIQTLLEAWSTQAHDIPLKIAGTGPLEADVRAVAETNPQVEYLGQCSPNQIFELLGQAKVLIFPSLWYEGMPRTIVEAFACGTPVIASNIGAMATMIDHQRTGLHINPGDAQALVGATMWMQAHEEDWQKMYQAARTEFETHYTAAANYHCLMQIYHQAIQSNQST